MMNTTKKLMALILLVGASQAYTADNNANATPAQDTLRTRVVNKIKSLQETSVVKFVSGYATKAYDYSSTKAQAGWTFAQANPYKTAAAALVATGIITCVIKKCYAQKEEADQDNNAQESSCSDKQSSCRTKGCAKN